MSYWFTADRVSPAYLEPELRKVFGDPDLRVVRVEQLPFDGGSGVLTQPIAERLRKWVGVHRFEAELAAPKGTAPARLRMIVKVKALDDEMMVMWNWMARRYGSRIERAWRRYQLYGPWFGSHLRELDIYAMRHPVLQELTPRLIKVHRNDESEEYVLILDEVTDALAIERWPGEGWPIPYVQKVIAGLGRIHSMYYGKEAELRAQPWLGHVMSASDAIEMEELWQAYADRMDELPDFQQRVKDFQQSAVRTVREWWPRLERMPRTLIHGDFTPRNLFLRGDPQNPSVSVYDWEVAMMNVPQVDLVEFLTFTLGTHATRAELLAYIEQHRRALSEASGHDIDPAVWLEGFRLALREFVIRRLPRYVLGVLIFPKRVGVPDIGRFFAHMLDLLEEE